MIFAMSPKINSADYNNKFVKATQKIKQLIQLFNFYKMYMLLYTRYPIVARAWPLGRVRARAKVSCIQLVWHTFIQPLGRVRARANVFCIQGVV